MTWQPIATAPDEGVHTRGMWVHSAKTKERLYWFAAIGYVDLDGDFCFTGGDQTGWHGDHFSHWMPAEDPPPD